MADRSLLTNSRIAKFRGCPRSHYLAYTLGYRAVRSALPLRFGTAGHRALEAYWRARMVHGSTRDQWIDAALASLRSNPEELVPHDHAKLRAMVLGYFATWSAWDLEVLGVEVEFTSPLLNPETGGRSQTYDLAGKMDALVRSRRTNAIAIVEHKFTSSSAEVGSAYRERLAIDSQIDQYFAGAHALGHEAQYVLYDVLTKPALRPLAATPLDKRVLVREKVRLEKPKVGKYARPPSLADESKDDYAARCVAARGAYALRKSEALAAHATRVKEAASLAPSRLKKGQRAEDETPDEYEARLIEAIQKDPSRYYQVVRVPRLEEREREHAFDVWQIGRSIADAERMNRHPRNADACFRYGAPCEFWSVCTNAASIDDPYRYRKASSVHEELDGGEETSA